MPRGKQSKGRCSFCGTILAKNGAIKHIGTCAHWKEAVEKAEVKKGKSEYLYQIRAQANGAPQFWLDLEIRGSATLKKLDDYLRKIWLECCGHMSQFYLGKSNGSEIPMNARIADLFYPGAELTHIYDFGTPSETIIKTVAVREGKPLTSHPITMLFRNEMPEYECSECENISSWLCMDCLIEEGEWVTLCDRHEKTHSHNADEDAQTIRLVNSPRLGLCGYTGPAEPPY